MKVRNGDDGSLHFELLPSNKLHQSKSFIHADLIFSKMAESPDVLFNLCGVKPTIEINFVHTRMSEEFKRIFNQGCICQGKKTLDATGMVRAYQNMYWWQMNLLEDVQW